MQNVVIGTVFTVTVNLTTQSPTVYATGVIVLQANGITIATQPLVALPLVGANASGTVFSIQSSTLGLGIFTLVAYYAGDVNYGATSYTSPNLVKNIIA